MEVPLFLVSVGAARNFPRKETRISFQAKDLINVKKEQDVT